MGNIFLYLWQLPQNLLALFILLFYRKRIKDRKEYKKGIKVFYIKKKDFGVSLGNYIILSDTDNEISLDHEYGHCIQSRWSGPFFLLVFGLPSIILNIICRLLIKVYKKVPQFVKNYYNRWPENQADRLGKVKRLSSYIN